jgi:hypothetical protein
VTSIEEGQIRADVAFYFMPDVWHLQGSCQLLWHPILDLCKFFKYSTNIYNAIFSFLTTAIQCKATAQLSCSSFLKRGQGRKFAHTLQALGMPQIMCSNQCTKIVTLPLKHKNTASQGNHHFWQKVVKMDKNNYHNIDHWCQSVSFSPRLIKTNVSLKFRVSK